jgi:hypothetical protein
MGCG